MRIVKASTKLGKSLIARGENVEGYRLSDVYSSYSVAKSDAFFQCWSEYICSANNPHDFAICSHNTFAFSVSWFDDFGMHLITPTNHYYVLNPTD